MASSKTQAGSPKPILDGKIFLVRLKPYNPRRGYVLKKYTHVPTGRKFEESLGWYKVDEELADYLRTVTQHHSDRESLPAFDVCTEEEALAIDANERKAKERKDANEANDLTTADLHPASHAIIAHGSVGSPVDERREMRARAHSR